MSRFFVLVKNTLVASHRDVIKMTIFRLFQAINLEILCNLCTEKCENNTFENADISNAGCVTFSFDGCFVKCFEHGSSVIIPF